MITLGIDLSSAKEGTAGCVIEWTKTQAIVRQPERRCDDGKLDELIAQADVVGIDAPFGWPEAFVEAVAGWRGTVWSPEERKRLRFRVTDLYVVEQLKIWPLSVSTDRIALPAMRANALLTRHGVRDRSGGTALGKNSLQTTTPIDGAHNRTAQIGGTHERATQIEHSGRRTNKFFEVYPAASLKRWGLSCRGYKLIDQKCNHVRRKILRGLRDQLPWLRVDDDYAADADALDALIASLTARAAAQGLTDKPLRAQVSAARREGWIHLPNAWPKL